MYHVDIVNKGDYKFDVSSKDNKFTIDLKGRGVTPPDALLASIGSCVGVYVRKYAEGAGIEIKEFDISVSADLTKDAPVRFARIEVSIDLKDAKVDDRRKAAMLEFIKNCPVHNTVKHNPETVVSYKV